MVDWLAWTAEPMAASVMPADLSRAMAWAGVMSAIMHRCIPDAMPACIGRLA